MKEVLFEVLKKIEPYQFITVSINHDYWTLCREDAIFPLATSVKRKDNPFNLRSHYSIFDAVDADTAESYEKYESEHTIEYNGINIVVEKEILEIEYADTHIKLVTQTSDGINTTYVNYRSIDYIKVKDIVTDRLVEDYNRLQYEISINK